MSVFTMPQHFVNRGEIPNESGILDFMTENSELGFHQSLNVLDNRAAWVDISGSDNSELARRSSGSVRYRVNLAAARNIMRFIELGFRWQNFRIRETGESVWKPIPGETLLLLLD